MTARGEGCGSAAALAGALGDGFGCGFVGAPASAGPAAGAIVVRMVKTTRRRRRVFIAAGSIREQEGQTPDIRLRVVVGADDAGPVLDAVVEELRDRGADVEMLPTEVWPQVARRVGEAVAEGRADIGVLACWTGTGTSIMANKVPGVRAALCWEPWIAEGARRWNDANVLVLSLMRTSPETAREIMAAWLAVEAPDPDEVDNIAEIGRYETRS